ncbi:MAG TPA: helix-hairpin-helix domain-containing protein [Thermomicrobiales bacterium]|nr:helix-hairpin-helix domain-containing protein [Thermomicrobiales bacterium]
MMTRVTNKDAAEVLFNVATILELAEDNPYRVRAYRRAAQLLLRTPDQAKLHLTAGKELDLPGLGPRLRRKLGELLSTGQMRFYVELCADLPEEVSQLMEIPSIGPKTARRLHEELGLTTAAEVVDAARKGKIRKLYGFGEKREQQLLEGAERVLAGFRKVASPMPIEAEDIVIETLPAPRLLPLPADHGHAEAA